MCGGKRTKFRFSYMISRVVHRWGSDRVYVSSKVETWISYVKRSIHKSITYKTHFWTGKIGSCEVPYCYRFQYPFINQSVLCEVNLMFQKLQSVLVLVVILLVQLTLMVCGNGNSINMAKRWVCESNSDCIHGACVGGRCIILERGFSSKSVDWL